MSYLVLPYERVIALQGSAEGRAYLAQLLPLRVIAPQERQRGPAMELFRLGAGCLPAGQFGGQIRLLAGMFSPPPRAPATKSRCAFTGSRSPAARQLLGLPAPHAARRSVPGAGPAGLQPGR